ncbi:N-acyl-D-amino-acid deacylase family protein [Novosphingobium sp. JCM 18896]|uniref:N-acyl-D-amino-acid deacylase family protein n=1 Tax=Novosphingobium sp. JCM 18896 TaxID=2989731 RepID=UPI002221435B|nr:amidohydrolase family protein [Novosphingobium sp. JCM 18896]MCW1431079.1 amidohydrolase family protein [Novosphingobium sp. JCM 18896]
MLDIKITGGTIVDGTGRAQYRGDVGIRDGRILALGAVAEDARETIDATGRIVAPGFIDVHTHYDAQAFWDPALSPSCFHGVTTVIGGFCGFSIAPLTEDSASYIKPMLARVEGMPLETLDQAVPWNWSSFAEFLGRLDGRVGLNAGFFAGHSAIRRIVMGPRAVGEKATSAEIEAMQELLGESLAGGAMGFSTTISPSHVDGDGQPVPSRWAAPEELVALAGVVRHHEGTGLELLPDTTFPDGTAELMADFSVAGDRPVNWNILVVSGAPDAEQRVTRQLAVSDLARARGGEVIALTVPSTPQSFLTLRSQTALHALPGIWRDLFALPPEARIERMKDPATRDEMARQAELLATSGTMMSFQGHLGKLTLRSIRSPAYKALEGRNVEDIAAEQGQRVIDVLLDVAIADDLETVMTFDMGGNDQATWDIRGRVWADDRTLIGASDAGAHLDMIDTFAFSTTVLQKGVREHAVIGLEQAVHQMTQRAARYFGLKDRGEIAEGFHADLVIFDLETVGRGRTYFRYDLPGDAEAYRVYADAEGINRVIVNGTVIVENGVHTGRLPGKVLRSGTDSRTVPIGALRS